MPELNQTHSLIIGSPYAYALKHMVVSKAILNR